MPKRRRKELLYIISRSGEGLRVQRNGHLLLSEKVGMLAQEDLYQYVVLENYNNLISLHSPVLSQMWSLNWRRERSLGWQRARRLKNGAQTGTLQEKPKSIPKGRQLWIQSLQPEMTKRLTSSNLECPRVRNTREIGCHFERLLEEHFRQAIITSEERSSFIQHTDPGVPQATPTGPKSCEYKECKTSSCQPHQGQHERHNKEIDCKCGECGKAFNSRSDLIK